MAAALLVVLAALLGGAPLSLSQSVTPMRLDWADEKHPLNARLGEIASRLRAGAAKDVIAALDAIEGEISQATPGIQSRARLIRAMALRNTGNLAAAEKLGVEAREAAGRAGFVAVEADALIFLVNIATAQNALDRAASLVADATRLADRTGEPVLRFNVRLESGRIARSRGRLGEALAALDEAVAIAATVGAPRMRVSSLTSRSAARLGRADYDGALADALLAYEIAGADGVAPDLKGAAAAGLAQAYGLIGDLERALDLWTDAIAGYTQANLLLGVSLGVRQRMDVRYALDDFAGAFEDGVEALSLFAKTGSQGQEPAVLSRLSLIATRLGRATAADGYTARATAALAGALPQVGAVMELDLANAALSAGNGAEAATRFARAVDVARGLRDLDLEWRAHQGLGRAALAGRQYARAEAAFGDAIRVIERVRRTLPEPSLRADFVAERLGPYDGLIDTLLRQSSEPGDAFVRRAFDVSERARGRALGDLLAEAQARLTDPAIAAIRAEEAEAGRRLSSLQRDLADATTSADRARIVLELERAEQAFDALVVRIRQRAPRYAALAHPAPATTSAIAASLGANDVLVSFWVGREEGTAWVIRQGGVRGHRLPGRRALERDVARLQAAIGAGLAADTRRLGEALYRSLFAGIDLTRTGRLIVVPDGPLWRVPFSALTVPAAGRSAWLVEHVAVGIVTAASQIVGTVRRGTPARQPALVFGLEIVPPAVRTLRALYDERLLPARPLAFAADEAQSVARATSADPRTAVFVNARADETTFKRTSAMPVRVLHVASHALVDDRVPRRSALILGASAADDGLLQLNEIANLTLDADLVVLSACQSQVGRSVRGEGLVGLSRAFLLSGARAVAGSLWAVDDRETARLMPWFYTALRAGQSPDQALRTAQRRMIQSGGPSAFPGSWAGFVITGESRRQVF